MNEGGLNLINKELGEVKDGILKKILEIGQLKSQGKEILKAIAIIDAIVNEMKKEGISVVTIRDEKQEILEIRREGTHSYEFHGLEGFFDLGELGYIEQRLISLLERKTMTNEQIFKMRSVLKDSESLVKVIGETVSKIKSCDTMVEIKFF